MLSCLRIQHLAIVDSLELQFEPGLNVITGETGAGKSIVVHALQLVLGERAKADSVRTGFDSAEVEALFEVGDDPSFQSRLEAMGFEKADEVVIRRVVQTNGRTRAYINGKLITISQLSELADGLADISSQHEHHTLINPSVQLEYLDAYAGNGALRQDMWSAHAELARLEREWDDAQSSAQQGLERMDLLRFHLQEIDAAELSRDELLEDQALQEERERLKHVEKIRFATESAEDALYSREGSVSQELSRVVVSLTDAAQFDKRLEAYAETLDRIQTEVQELARELTGTLRSVEADPERLLQIEDRLDLLQKLKRKFGGSIASVLDYRDRAAEELERIENRDEYLSGLRTKLDKATKAAQTVATRLSKERTKAAVALSRAISTQLQSLGMTHATVKVDVRPIANDASTEHKISASGFDRVELLFAPNVGEHPKPLASIASGGELSRTMLAIKRVLGGLGPAGVYVFDEVDTGVGGAVAEVIGLKLEEVSRFHQVVCITHLPQIAVYADAHYQARKETVGKRVQSTIVRLGGADHALDEVARMLGGLKVTEKTKEAAQEMLHEAKRSKQVTTHVASRDAG